MTFSIEPRNLWTDQRHHTGNRLLKLADTPSETDLMSYSDQAVEVLPADEFNDQLVNHVHPPDWQNPTPSGKYNLVAIGGGTAGLISSIATAGLGGKSALIERHLLGGDCLNVGCVPSKALIRAARVAHTVREAGEFGVHASPAGGVMFGEVMQRMRRLRAGISRHDSAQSFTDAGVDVFLGQATFTGPNTLEVGTQKLQFAKAAICNGARPARLPVEGFDEVGYLTNETLFSLTELPKSLIIIGSGPIGSEMAQAFRRFGAQVHIIDKADRIMSRAEPEASAVVQSQFETEGIHLHLNSKVIRAELTSDGKRVVVERDGQQHAIDGEEILLAVGRTPNVDDLGLNAAGVETTERGVQVNDYLQTTNPHIFAAGDIAGSYQFTHAADAMARICIRNALFFGRGKLSKLVVPNCTYTDPEVAQIGLTPAQAEQQGIAIDSYRQDLSSVDRAILDGETDGFAVIHTKRGKSEIVGATIVASHAGEMIGEVSLLMTKGLPVSALADTIHCYPTQVEVLKRIGDAYNKQKLTPFVAGLFRRLLAWRRS